MFTFQYLLEHHRILDSGSAQIKNHLQRANTKSTIHHAPLVGICSLSMDSQLQGTRYNISTNNKISRGTKDNLIEDQEMSERNSSMPINQYREGQSLHTFFNLSDPLAMKPEALQGLEQKLPSYPVINSLHIKLDSMRLPRLGALWRLCMNSCAIKILLEIDLPPTKTPCSRLINRERIGFNLHAHQNLSTNLVELYIN